MPDNDVNERVRALEGKMERFDERLTAIVGMVEKQVKASETFMAQMHMEMSDRTNTVIEIKSDIKHMVRAIDALTTQISKVDSDGTSLCKSHIKTTEDFKIEIKEIKTDMSIFKDANNKSHGEIYKALAAETKRTDDKFTGMLWKIIGAMGAIIMASGGIGYFVIQQGGK